MPQYGTWVPYTGGGAFLLAGTLVAIAALLAYGGSRLPHSISVRRPGRIVAGLLLTVWVLGLGSFLVSIVTYMQALGQRYGTFTPPASPIAPITFLSGAAAFFSIAFLTRARRFRVVLGSSVVGAMAGAMIFELPFDVIVMFRLYPPVATQFVLLFFLPLFLVGISTFSLLTLSPAMSVSQFTLFSLAAMFAVFAIWAFFGFGFPSSPMPFVLNALAKALSFLVAATLFLDASDR